MKSGLMINGKVDGYLGPCLAQEHSGYPRRSCSPLCVVPVGPGEGLPMMSGEIDRPTYLPCIGLPWRAALSYIVYERLPYPYLPTRVGT